MIKMIRFSLLLCVGLVVSACDTQSHNSLVGSWKSDTNKSLDSMRSMKDVPDETKAYFEKEFFGRLTMIYDDATYSAVLKGEEDIKPDSYPYKIVEESDEYYIVESELLGAKYNKKLFKDKSCYYELTSEWNFREYFCRVDD